MRCALADEQIEERKGSVWHCHFQWQNTICPGPVIRRGGISLVRGWGPRLRWSHSAGILNFIISGARVQWRILPLSPLLFDEGSGELTSPLLVFLLRAALTTTFIHLFWLYISLDTWRVEVAWWEGVWTIYTLIYTHAKWEQSTINIKTYKLQHRCTGSCSHANIASLLTHIYKDKDDIREWSNRLICKKLQRRFYSS